MIAYRKATVWDTGKICILWAKMHVEVDTFPAIKKEYADLKSFFLKLAYRIESKDWFVYIAEEDKKIAGFIMSYVHWPLYNQCHIVGTCEALYVEPEYRGQNIYKQLINDSIEWAEKNEAKEIEFFGVFDKQMITFWDRYGFQPVQIIYRRRKQEVK